MKDLDYLRLLSEKFRNRRECRSEIVNLTSVLGLPKGTEYFFSDIHGEYKAFIHQLRSASGNIRTKITEVFDLPEEEMDALFSLVYSPEEYLMKEKREGRLPPARQKELMYRLILLCRHIASKYSRGEVRRSMPGDYAHIMDELLQVNEDDRDKRVYYQAILDAIVDTDGAVSFMVDLCGLIHKLSVNYLHILGDLFDRGPRADRVIDELQKYRNVDIVWGNHDVSWMGAYCGNDACICSVLRIALSYNSFDVLEDGYGINLRALSMFAESVYGDDPCERFQPHLLDENKYDTVFPLLTARMQKAIAVMQFKAEGRLIREHPEYGMEDRLLLDKMDPAAGTVRIGGKDYPLLDTRFPTVDPADPYAFTPGEEALMETLRASFRHSAKLRDHIRYLYTHGALYSRCNGNLLYHGCIPMTEDGGFAEANVSGMKLSGRALMDYFGSVISDAFQLSPEDPRSKSAADMMWYLWCGRMSPLFGKDRITTFERLFVGIPELQTETMNPYYSLIESEETVKKILREFDLPEEGGHIVNGHVPVRLKAGEKPCRANGRLFMIDGGLAKSFHEQTGLAGYTLIANSHYIALARHSPYEEGRETSPILEIVERMPTRRRVADTDQGLRLKKQAGDLRELLKAYEDGVLRERG